LRSWFDTSFDASSFTMLHLFGKGVRVWNSEVWKCLRVETCW
jgi:hypothetical protein